MTNIYWCLFLCRQQQLREHALVSEIIPVYFPRLCSVSCSVRAVYWFWERLAASHPGRSCSFWTQLTSVKMNHLGCLSSTEENAIQYSRPVNPATLKLVTLDMWKYFVREALHHLSVVGNITHPLWAGTFKTAFVAELLYFAWYFTGVAAIVSTPL